MGDEQKRRDVRVVTAREVDVRIVDRASGLASGDGFAAEVRNISVGGALLVMPEPLWRGPTLEIRIGWADPRLVTSLRAHVVRVAPCKRGVSVSVQFQHPDSASRLQMLRWVLQEARKTGQLSARIRA